MQFVSKKYIFLQFVVHIFFCVNINLHTMCDFNVTIPNVTLKSHMYILILKQRFVFFNALPTITFRVSWMQFLSGDTFYIYM